MTDEKVEATLTAIGPPLTPTEAEAQRDAVLKPAIQTAAQSRIDAVAALTQVAISKAATLQLTADETAALVADFPDADFQPGAAGKENLLYIEHSALRNRLNTVLGLGQWAIIVRDTWNEDFKTQKGIAGVRVYARGMLLVRGCYVGESVGDMDYYPSNASQNYGDAFEGAKTAAFRRCAKEFGIGLQAWRKDFASGWFARRSNTQKSYGPKNAPATGPSEPSKRVESPPSASGEASGNVTEAEAVLVDWKEITGVTQAGKRWTGWICKFEDPDGHKLEAGTFSKSTRLKLEVCKGQLCTVRYQPGRKPSTFELVAIDPVLEGEVTP